MRIREPAWISRSQDVVSAYQQDPLVHNRITPTLAALIARGGEAVLARAADWTLPTLLMWAGADRCVAPAGSSRFAAAAPKAVVQAQCYDKLYHEIFNEPEQQQVFERLRQWLERM